MAATRSPAVVVVSGHMVDVPGRDPPRFPPDQVGRVTAEVRTALERWDVGPQTTVVSGGARGADIIVAEECLRLGAQVILCLASPPEEFVTQSVAIPDSDWTDRFHALCTQAEVRILDSPPDGDEVYARTNEWMVGLATALAQGRPHAIVVWNGGGGDGPGGTADFVRRLGFSPPDPAIVVIDPTPRADEAK